jgi:YggT family protein
VLSKLIFLCADALAILCWGRLLLQWGNLPFLHPLAQFCIKGTNWLVRPLRKVLPPLGRWDSACIMAVIIIYYLATLLNLLSDLSRINVDMRIIAANVLLNMLLALKSLCYALFLGLLVRVFLSFSTPYSILLQTLQRIYGPLTRPFNFLRIGNYDFSATILLIVLYLSLEWCLPAAINQVSVWVLTG